MKPVLRRLRHDLFATPGDGVLSVGLLALLAFTLVGLLRWAFVQARWAVIQANSTLFAVGRYPVAQQWRLWLLVFLLAGAAGLSWGLLRAHPRPDRQGILWPRNDKLAAALLALAAVWLPWALHLEPALQGRWWALAALLIGVRWLAGRHGTQLPPRLLRLVPLVWPALYLTGMVLISGGLGLVTVSPSEWGGLLLTLLAASFAILLCFPQRPGAGAGLACRLGAHLLCRRLSGGGRALRFGGRARRASGGGPLPGPLLSPGPATGGAPPSPAGGPAVDGGAVHLPPAGHHLAVADWFARIARRGPHGDGQPCFPWQKR